MSSGAVQAVDSAATPASLLSSESSARSSSFCSVLMRPGPFRRYPHQRTVLFVFQSSRTPVGSLVHQHLQWSLFFPSSCCACLDHLWLSPDTFLLLNVERLAGLHTRSSFHQTCTVGVSSSSCSARLDYFLNTFLLNVERLAGSSHSSSV